jgi:DNA processing protein
VASTAAAPKYSVRDCGPEHLALLSLSCLKGVGFKTLQAIADAGVLFSDVLSTDKTDDAVTILKSFGARIEGNVTDWPSVRAKATERAERYVEDFKHDGVSLILRGSPDYPSQLLDLPSAPHWLFVQGSVDVLHRPSIAVVGTRKPSEDGLFLGQYVGACFREWGALTVSGLALGIDQQAHELSLRAGVPTIAFLGTGIFSEYPKGSATLRERILTAGGAIVTEYLPRETYSADNFVKRNRLQAALSRVLIPVEWNFKSGTAHTVRFAASLKRPIVCLRMPDWTDERLSPSALTKYETCSVFTIPGEEPAFREHVKRKLTVPRPHPNSQIPLFDE